MLVAPQTEKGMKDEIRTILSFAADNLKAFTPLYTDTKYKRLITGYIATWRWYLSHGYWKEEEHRDRQKPPINWLYTLLTSHRSAASMVSLLATPGLTPSTDAKNAADILKLKLSRIETYVEPVEIPETFYLPPSDPKKTDQEGIPWAKSKSGAAKKYRKTLKIRADELKTLEPKPRYEKTPAELKAYRKAKNDRREYERKTRADIDKELIRRTKSEQRRQKEHGNKT